MQRYFCIFSNGCSGIIHSGETVFLRRIENLVKHLRWSLYSWNFYAKGSILDGWLSSKYSSVIKSAEKDCFYLLFSIHFSGAFIHSHKIIDNHNIHKIKTMTTVSYDYGLSDGSFRLYYKQQYFIDSECLIYGLR